MKKIISIDKDAENYKKNMQELLNKEKKNLDATLKEMRIKAQNEIDTKNKEIFDEKIKQAQSVVYSIEKENSEKLENIKKIYKDEKNNLVDEAFTKLINSYKEG